jgi:hypothetical protein
MAITTPTTAHVLIGNGAHSEVLHRPGSRWVVQRFRASSPLTAQRLAQEYDYLRATYATMPGLIPPQRLFRPTPDAPLEQILLVKEYIDLDNNKTLLRIHADTLSSAERLQLVQFVTITRTLLALPLAGDIPPTGVPRLPDIIDENFRNLAFDRNQHLRLLDTNELISTAHLYELIGTDTTLNLQHRHIHAKFLTRMLHLETLTGRTRQELMVDPLYRGYLSPNQIDTLLVFATNKATRTPTPSGSCK